MATTFNKVTFALPQGFQSIITAFEATGNLEEFNSESLVVCAKLQARNKKLAQEVHATGDAYLEAIKNMVIANRQLKCISRCVEEGCVPTVSLLALSETLHKEFPDQPVTDLRGKDCIPVTCATSNRELYFQHSQVTPLNEACHKVLELHQSRSDFSHHDSYIYTTAILYAIMTTMMVQSQLTKTEGTALYAYKAEYIEQSFHRETPLSHLFEHLLLKSNEIALLPVNLTHYSSESVLCFLELAKASTDVAIRVLKKQACLTVDDSILEVAVMHTLDKSSIIVEDLAAAHTLQTLSIEGIGKSRLLECKSSKSGKTYCPSKPPYTAAAKPKASTPARTRTSRAQKVSSRVKPSCVSIAPAVRPSTAESTVWSRPPTSLEEVNRNYKLFMEKGILGPRWKLDASVYNAVEEMARARLAKKSHTHSSHPSKKH